MVILNGQLVWLEAGETIPVFCPGEKCGFIYAPDSHSEFSECPACGRTNVHGCMASIQVSGPLASPSPKPKWF